MFRLDEINEDGKIINSKDYKTLKECSDKTGVSYKKIQNLYYFTTGKLKYTGRQKSDETNQLINRYRLSNVEKHINISFDT